MIALIRHLVESSLFASVMLLVVACLRDRGPSTRHTLLLCAVLKFAIPLHWLIDLGALLRTRLPLPAIQDLVPTGIQRITLPIAANAQFTTGKLLNVTFYLVWFVAATLLLFGWLRRLCAPIDVSGDVPSTAKLALQRMKARVGITREVCLKTSPAGFEPRLIGLVRPTVVLPQTLSLHLSAEELDAVLLHELAHVHRWDNLTRAAVHVLTCVFWFFPLLTWLERRIDAECELACDELVLICGVRPHEYLAGILKVCQFFLLEPIAGASNVSGSNLKRRMEFIMSFPITKASNVSAGIVAALLFSCLATAIILTGFLTPPQGRAQTAASVTVRAHVTCLFNGTDFAEGTVIQMGKDSEQMCVQLRDRPLWVKTSDEARERSLKLVSLPAPAPFLCTPAAPAGKYCTCKVQGKFSPGAVVNSDKGPLVCAASGGEWRPYKR